MSRAVRRPRSAPVTSSSRCAVVDSGQQTRRLAVRIASASTAQVEGERRRQLLSALLASPARRSGRPRRRRSMTSGSDAGSTSRVDRRRRAGRLPQRCDWALRPATTATSTASRRATVADHRPARRRRSSAATRCRRAARIAALDPSTRRTGVRAVTTSSPLSRPDLGAELGLPRRQQQRRRRRHGSAEHDPAGSARRAWSAGR